jgi:GMP synthase (glutamine-hydrolysing)
MPKLLVFQHVAYEILGTLNSQLKDAGFRIRYVNFGREPAAEPALDGYNGLVVLGGPMNTDQIDEHPHLATEVRVIGDAIERGMPILGICLGAQLIAKALGAGVCRNSEKEIGWYEVCPTEDGRRDPLIGKFGPAERIFQWHGDTFDIPEGGVRLAASQSCPNQAFRYGDNVYGLQFHLEVDERLIERWLLVPHHCAEIAELGGRIDPDVVRLETKANIERSKRLARDVFGSFIEVIGQPRRAHVLPSR